MRLIDADAIYNAVESRYRVSSGIEHRSQRDLLDLICEQETIDPESLRARGKWNEVEQPCGWSVEMCAECSVCGEDFILEDYTMDIVRDVFKYCPNCGAKMEVSEDA